VTNPLRWLLLLAPALAGCDSLPGKPDRDQREIRPDDILDFSYLYKNNCAGCHGAGGRLGPAPPLNDPVFLAIVPDKTLHEVIRRGRKGTLMPAFALDEGGPLTSAQVDALAEGLKKHFKPARLKGNVPSYLYKEGGSPDRGAEVFDRACAMCHGDDGKGGEMAGAIYDPDFLALVSNQLLRRLAITGRPDFGMPGYGPAAGREKDFEPLTDAEVTDLVAFLASWRTASGGGK
jgi:mono/diheme cytochrome c family protein